MAAPNNVELEAAKFLHKLIQDSKDEPAKLATKLYVVSILFFFIFIFIRFLSLCFFSLNMLYTYIL